MKYTVLLLSLISFSVSSQNLVSNSGFETYSFLPNGPGQYNYATGWGNCNGGGSPDYFHMNGSGLVDLPVCFIGTVYPYEGNGIMGFCPYYNLADFREYVSSQLTNPLVIGNTYVVSFWITSGLNSGAYCGQGIDKVSVAFTVGGLTQIGYAPMTSVTPQWTTPTIMYDTIWKQITFSFVADAAYDHITFGSFVTDAQTTVQTFYPTSSPGAYYFLDGISVIPDSSSIVNFAASDTNFCQTNCIDFNDLSGNNATAWQWFFPGATPDTSSLQNPSNICYSTPGSYDVTLITTSANGNDTLTLPGYITVNAAPTAPTITQSNDTLTCSSANTYQWYFNAAIIGGATDQLYVASQSGLYSVVITNGSGCSASADFLYSLLAFSSSDTSLCEKFCINFTDQSNNNPTAWLWIFPGGSPSSSTQQNPANICYDVPGTYDVTLITTSANGVDTITLPGFITVNATPPFPTITQNGYLLTSSAATSYQWQFNSYDIPGATNQSYAVMQSGFYTVIVGDENGCVNSASTYVLIDGLDDLPDESGIFISPNPSSGNFTIEFLNTEISGDVSIEVVNAIGQKIYSSIEKIPQSDFKKQINIENAANGIYFIEIKSKGEFMSKKIVVVM